MRAAILLAAGHGRRFGGDKLKSRIGGCSLRDRALDNALRAVRGRVLLVAPRPVRRVRVTHVRLSGSAGLSESLRAGLRALRPIEREVLIFLADMPFACAPRMRLGGGDAVRPRYRGVPGHPMLVRSAAARLHLGQGDAGLGERMRAGFVPGDRGNILDIDTRAALRAARLHGSRAFRRRS